VNSGNTYGTGRMCFATLTIPVQLQASVLCNEILSKTMLRDYLLNLVDKSKTDYGQSLLIEQQNVDTDVRVGRCIEKRIFTEMTNVLKESRLYEISDLNVRHLLFEYGSIILLPTLGPLQEIKYCRASALYS